jgi:hypothetical protein
VAPVNDVPVSEADAFSGDEDQPISGNVLDNDSDVDGDALNAILVSGPANGSLQFETGGSGSFSYTPNARLQRLDDSFSYRANDGQVDGSIVVVTLSVAPINDLPVSTDDAFTRQRRRTAAHSLPPAFSPTTTDIDSPTLTASYRRRPAARQPQAQQ